MIIILILAFLWIGRAGIRQSMLGLVGFNCNTMTNKLVTEKYLDKYSELLTE